jgi:hypothetical protein
MPPGYGPAANCVVLAPIFSYLLCIVPRARERVAANVKGAAPVLGFSALLALTSCVLTAETAHAASPSVTLAAKIRSFEVLGIHLGMTLAQVDAALVKHGYSLTSVDAPWPDDLTHSGPCVNDYIAALRAGKSLTESSGKCVYWQQPAYHGNLVSGRNLLIYYCEDYPTRPGTMRVVEITFNQSLQTDADARAFKLALFSRMGMRPTWESKDRTSGSYCSFKYWTDRMSLVSDSSPCPVDPTFIFLGPGAQHVDAEERGVTLGYSSKGGSLALQDRDFLIIHRTASNKAIEATRSPAKMPF